MTNDCDGRVTITISKAGQFVTPTNGALQETQIELWEGGEDGTDWKPMHAIAAFTSEPESAGRLRLAHKPLAAKLRPYSLSAPPSSRAAPLSRHRPVMRPATGVMGVTRVAWFP